MALGGLGMDGEATDLCLSVSWPCALFVHGKPPKVSVWRDWGCIGVSTTTNNRLVTESGPKIHTEALLESEVRFLRLAVGQAGMYRENEGLVLSIFN